MGMLNKSYRKEDILLNDKSKITSVLMLATAVLTLITALTGVFYNKTYLDLVNEDALSNFAAAGAVNQDILSIPIGLALVVISILLLKNKDYKLLITALGLTGYIFYGYAVYTFGIMLTPLYLAYIATFCLSVYCLIMGILSFEGRKMEEKLRLGKRVRISVGVFLVIMTTVLSLKWVADILSGSLSQTHQELYLIAALDLSVALPAIGISAVMLLKNRVYGIILSGIALIKTFTLCLSVALGTFIAPYFDLPADYDTFVFFTILAEISLILMVLFFKGIGLKRNING